MLPGTSLKLLLFFLTLALFLTPTACQTCPPNCTSCTNTTCSTCADGSFPNSNGLCSPCPSSCLTCSSSSTCTSCSSRRYLYGSFCQSCSSSISNCDTCNSSSQCSQCYYGYKLTEDNQTCIREYTNQVLGISVMFVIAIVLTCCCCCCILNRKTNQIRQLREQNERFMIHGAASQSAVAIPALMDGNNLSGQMNPDNSVWKQYNQKQTCPICLDHNLDLQTSCGHKYHRDCLLMWNQRNRTCPQCRKQYRQVVRVICKWCWSMYREMELGEIRKGKNIACERCLKEARNRVYLDI